MRQNAPCEHRLRELIDADLPADELARLACVDALLRVAAAHDREEAATLTYRKIPNRVTKVDRETDFGRPSIAGRPIVVVRLGANPVSAVHP
jgi:hypothetical protein